MQPAVHLQSARHPLQTPQLMRPTLLHSQAPPSKRMLQAWLRRAATGLKSSTRYRRQLEPPLQTSTAEQERPCNLHNQPQLYAVYIYCPPTVVPPMQLLPVWARLAWHVGTLWLAQETGTCAVVSNEGVQQSHLLPCYLRLHTGWQVLTSVHQLQPS